MACLCSLTNVRVPLATDLIEQRNIGWTELTNPEGALRIDQQARRHARRLRSRLLRGSVKGRAITLLTGLRACACACAWQLLLPKGQRSTTKIVEARLPGIASAARNELRREFDRIVFLHLSVASAGPNEMEMASLAVTSGGADPTSAVEILDDGGAPPRGT